MAGRLLFQDMRKPAQRGPKVFAPAFTAGLAVSLLLFSASLQKSQYVAVWVNWLAVLSPGLFFSLGLSLSNAHVRLKEKIIFTGICSLGHVLNIFLLFRLSVISPFLVIALSVLTAATATLVFHYFFHALMQPLSAILLSVVSGILPIMLVLIFANWSMEANVDQPLISALFLYLFSPLWLGLLGLVLERYAVPLAEDQDLQ